METFKQFCDASGLLDAATAKQINMLLYTMGEEAETVLSATNITEEERKP